MSEFVITKEHSPVESLLGIEFASDPRKARIRLPQPPAGWDDRYAFPVSAAEFEITPDLAYDILRYRMIWRPRTPKELLHKEFVDNRVWSLAWVRYWADPKTVFNPGITASVAFTRDGFCLDGQHRIAGAYLGKKTIRIPGFFATPWSAFKDSDSGRARTTSQLLVHDYPMPKAAATAARMIFPLLSDEEQHLVQDSRISRQEQINLVQAWPFFQSHEHARAVRLAAHHSKVPGSALYAAVAMALAAGWATDWRSPSGQQIDWCISQFLHPLGVPEEKLKLSHFDEQAFGPKGADPRWLLRRLFEKGKTNNAVLGDTRAQTSYIRRALTVWLNMEQNLSKLAIPDPGKPMTPVWQADAVRKYAVQRELAVRS